MLFVVIFGNNPIQKKEDILPLMIEYSIKLFYVLKMGIEDGRKGGKLPCNRDNDNFAFLRLLR